MIELSQGFDEEWCTFSDESDDIQRSILTVMVDSHTFSRKGNSTSEIGKSRLMIGPDYHKSAPVRFFARTTQYGLDLTLIVGVKTLRFLGTASMIGPEHSKSDAVRLDVRNTQ